MSDLKVAPEILDYKMGITAGMSMSASECLRFFNGMVAALNTDIIKSTRDPQEARRGIPGVMDMLAADGMRATVGFRGCPVIFDLGD